MMDDAISIVQRMKRPGQIWRPSSARVTIRPDVSASASRSGTLNGYRFPSKSAPGVSASRPVAAILEPA
jgi:hypothetical protein